MSIKPIDVFSFHEILKVINWKTHVAPYMSRPQDVINRQIGDYDIFVGIMWKRFGTPTGKAGSGTEEEFRIAYDRWVKNKRPHILNYLKSETMYVDIRGLATGRSEAYQFCIDELYIPLKTPKCQKRPFTPGVSKIFIMIGVSA